MKAALPEGEQAQIDAAVHDGEGWALPEGTAEGLIETLSTKGLIRMWKGRWQLTPAGFGQSAMFRG